MLRCGWACLVWTLAVTLAWTNRAAAESPENASSIPSALAGRQVAADSAPATPIDPVSEPDAYPMSGNPDREEPGLVERVAELEKALKVMKDKEAAAKEKSAGVPSVKAGGRIMVDWANFSQNAASLAQAGDCLNGTEFRRARLSLSGEAFHVVDYEIEFDFAGQTDFKDVYMTINELPWLGHLRVGHFKEPFSLEELTSSRYITFMERGLNNVFAPGYRTGVMAFDHSQSENMTWAIGAFATLIPENPPKFPSENFDDAGGTSLTMRYTFLPWYDEATEGRGLLHTGICYTYRDIPELAPGKTNRFRLATRPEAHLAEYVANTGYLDDAATVNALDVELAWVYGPFSMQSEYTWFWLHRSANDAPTFHGGYVGASWFLTGEHRSYSRTAGKFSRVKPFENFFRVRTEDGRISTGRGAWELAYRWSYVSLNDAGVRGGRVGDHTVGVNWYLNPYMRVMFNYIHSETKERGAFADAGIVDAVETRFQIDF
jgi:phosphate-selective porin OprO/OprP